MNNSIFTNETPEAVVDIKPMLRERQVEVVEILEAIENIKSSSYWNVLQQKVFSKRTALLIKKLKNAEDTKDMFRLQGMIQESELRTDLATLSLSLRKELESIKSQLQ